MLILLESLLFNLVRVWEYERDGGKMKPNLRSYGAFVLWYENVASGLVEFLLPLLIISISAVQVAANVGRHSDGRHPPGSGGGRDEALVRRHTVHPARREKATVRMMLQVAIGGCDGFTKLGGRELLY